MVKQVDHYLNEAEDCAKASAICEVPAASAVLASLAQAYATMALAAATRLAI